MRFNVKFKVKGDDGYYYTRPYFESDGGILNTIVFPKDQNIFIKIIDHKKNNREIMVAMRVLFSNYYTYSNLLIYNMEISHIVDFRTRKKVPFQEIKHLWTKSTV